MPLPPPPQPGNRCHRRRSRSRSCLPPSFLRSFVRSLRARALLQFPVGVQGQAAFLRQNQKDRPTDRPRQRDSARVVVVAREAGIVRVVFRTQVRCCCLREILPSVSLRPFRSCQRTCFTILQKWRRSSELSVPQEVGGAFGGGDGDGGGMMEVRSRGGKGGGKESE